MKQCVLKREVDGKTTMTTTWLDESKIKVGCQVRLKGESEFWTVMEMSNKSLSKEYVNERSQDYKHTRSASDI
jgi:hypothetical protein